MTRLRRPVLALALLVAPFFTGTLSAQIQEAFDQGVQALDRGQEEEALGHFQRILAMDPSRDAAWDLFNQTDYTVWLRLLSAEGEIELTAKRLMGLAEQGRRERSNDPDAIRELLGQVADGDPVERAKAIHALASNHGEYAVPLMLFSLGDRSNDERRVNVMAALSRMGTDVVVPLIEALASPDGFLRRNVAYSLGYIGDPRARAVLAAHAAGDEDPNVRSAAATALQKCGGQGNASPAELYLTQGDAYYQESDSVLAPHQYSDVLWHWEGKGLVSVECPRFLYAPEMAKKAYYQALALSDDPTSALAGIARSAVAERQRMNEWVATGQEVGEWPERLTADDLAVQLAGPQALDRALGWALDTRDSLAASGLCQVIGAVATASTPNLQRALGADKSGAVRGEAAVAAAGIAYRTQGTVSADTVAALADAASREVLRIGAVIDADENRRRTLTNTLSGEGLEVNGWPTAGRGLASLKAVPGIDVLLIADRLPDLTLDQVVDDLRRDPRTSEMPILVISTDGEEGEYGEGVDGVITSTADLSAVEAALSGRMNRDREQANLLAARAAESLLALALSGRTDVSSAAGALAGTLEKRPESVVLPALGALGLVGGTSHVSAVLGVLQSGERSDAVRAQAARALGGIFARSGSADSGVLEAVRSVALEGDAFEVRAAAAGALGRLDLPRELRVELMRAVRGQ